MQIQDNRTVIRPNGQFIGGIVGRLGKYACPPPFSKDNNIKLRPSLRIFAIYVCECETLFNPVAITSGTDKSDSVFIPINCFAA